MQTWRGSMFPGAPGRPGALPGPAATSLSGSHGRAHLVPRGAAGARAQWRRRGHGVSADVYARVVLLIKHVSVVTREVLSHVKYTEHTENSI